MRPHDYEASLNMKRITVICVVPFFCRTSVHPRPPPSASPQPRPLVGYPNPAKVQ
ncbi:hypothetical protein RvY_14729 [Ramazzottius varieornatus]|uniref:Uncharacterized protein n=1 Tax=Ramazzottius varieornatus TaxID=947166 RepID=A0A1D1VSB5_RAMVA|nr:hypothetical protein RvY_14729 [Ramazzottius varieornatus]